MNRSLLERALAEAGGTALLVGIGTGGIVLVARDGGSPQVALPVVWFFAVLIPIALFIDVSGAHLNPVVTASLAASGRIGWREVPPYVLAQFTGALLGSALVLESLGDYARLGATVPARGDALPAFGAELALTATLVAAVFLLADRGEGRGRWRILLPPGVVGVATYLIGPWTGSSLNPVRTLAPALLGGTYTDLWVYLVAVPIGGLLVAAAWRPRAVDRLDRGPGRSDVNR